MTQAIGHRIVGTTHIAKKRPPADGSAHPASFDLPQLSDGDQVVSPQDRPDERVKKLGAAGGFDGPKLKRSAQDLLRGLTATSGSVESNRAPKKLTAS